MGYVKHSKDLNKAMSELLSDDFITNKLEKIKCVGLT